MAAHIRAQRYMELALKRAIHMDDIPAEYRRLPVIGRGVTSIVLAESDEHVLVFTRDEQKVEWMTRGGFGLELGEHVTELQGRARRIPSRIKEIPVYVVRMPRLEKLDAANKRRVRGLIAEFERLRTEARNKAWRMKRDEFMGYTKDEWVFRELHAFYTDNEDHPLHGLFNYLSNYEETRYRIDLHGGNFMQTRDGTLVVLDPIISRDLLDFAFGVSQKQY